MAIASLVVQVGVAKDHSTGNGGWPKSVTINESTADTLSFVGLQGQPTTLVEGMKDFGVAVTTATQLMKKEQNNYYYAIMGTGTMMPYGWDKEPVLKVVAPVVVTPMEGTFYSQPLGTLHVTLGAQAASVGGSQAVSTVESQPISSTSPQVIGSTLSQTTSSTLSQVMSSTGASVTTAANAQAGAVASGTSLQEVKMTVPTAAPIVALPRPKMTIDEYVKKLSEGTENLRLITPFVKDKKGAYEGAIEYTTWYRQVPYKEIMYLKVMAQKYGEPIVRFMIIRNTDTTQWADVTSKL